MNFNYFCLLCRFDNTVRMQRRVVFARLRFLGGTGDSFSDDRLVSLTCSDELDSSPDFIGDE